MNVALPFNLALIPCTDRKDSRAGGVPMRAAHLYSASPRFQLMYRHAMQRASRIVIMSALYGLINPDDEVRYYNAYLPTLSQQDREALRDKVRNQTKALALQGEALRVLSYLPQAYHDFLVDAGGEPLRAGWNMRRPYAGLDMFAQAQVLRLEVAYYGKLPDRRG